MICQYNNCTKEVTKGAVGFCKKHWLKVPRKLKTELKQKFDDEGAITVVDQNEFILKAQYAIKMPNNWERRAKFELNKLRKQEARKKVIIVNGMACGPRNYESPHWKIFDRIKGEILPKGKSIYTTIYHGDQLIQFFKDFPPAAVILLGESGVHALIDDRTFNDDGWVRGGNKILTLEQVKKAKFDQRPLTPTHSYNKYYSAPTLYCDAHPDEYDELGELEQAEIEKCLEWAKQFLR